MWKKTWGFAEGFAIGGGLLLSGLMLQWTVGPVNWDLFAFPANLIAIILLVVALVVMAYFRRKLYFFRWITTPQAAVPALFYAVVLTVVMGLTRQVSSTADPIDPLGISKMLSFWPFVLSYLWMSVIVGEIAIVQIIRLVRSEMPLSQRFYMLPSLVCHIGLFIVVVAGTLGSADMKRLKIYTVVGEPEWRALNEQQNIVELPLAIELNKFILEEWEGDSIEQRTPKRFASDVQILTKSGKNIHAVIEVNKPLTVDGWKIYQYGYDYEAGVMSQISVFEVVNDSWMTVVYVGIYMLLVGSALVFIVSQRRKIKEK